MYANSAFKKWRFNSVIMMLKFCLNGLRLTGWKERREPGGRKKILHLYCCILRGRKNTSMLMRGDWHAVTIVDPVWHTSLSQLPQGIRETAFTHPCPIVELLLPCPALPAVSLGISEERHGHVRGKARGGANTLTHCHQEQLKLTVSGTPVSYAASRTQFPKSKLSTKAKFL